MSVPTVEYLKERLNMKVYDTKTGSAMLLTKKYVIVLGKLITVYHGESSNFQIGNHKLYFYSCPNSSNVSIRTQCLMFLIKEICYKDKKMFCESCQPGRITKLRKRKKVIDLPTMHRISDSLCTDQLKDQIKSRHRETCNLTKKNNRLCDKLHKKEAKLLVEKDAPAHELLRYTLSYIKKIELNLEKIHYIW